MEFYGLKNLQRVLEEGGDTAQTHLECMVAEALAATRHIHLAACAVSIELQELTERARMLPNEKGIGGELIDLTADGARKYLADLLRNSIDEETGMIQDRLVDDWTRRAENENLKDYNRKIKEKYDTQSDINYGGVRRTYSCLL